MTAARSRASLEQELAQLIRARANWMRWYGGVERSFLKRTGARMAEVKRQLAELDKETK